MSIINLDESYNFHIKYFQFNNSIIQKLVKIFKMSVISKSTAAQIGQVIRL